MLKVDKLCALRFITLIIKLMIAIHHIINVKGHRLELANWAALNDLYSPELTAAKFTISPMGFEHSPGCEKFESQNLRKLNFSVLISHLLPTCQEKLMEELSEKSIFR